jgi:competence protein ComEC
MGAGQNRVSTSARAVAAPWTWHAPRHAERLRWTAAILRELRGEVDGRRLFLWLPVMIGLGVLLWFAADGLPSPWPALATGAILAGLAFRLRARPAAFVALVALAAVMAGFAAAAWRAGVVAAPVLAEPFSARFEGFVRAIDHGPAGGRMVVEITRLDSTRQAERPARVRLSFQGPLSIRPGDHIALAARLMPPPQPAYPGGYDFARDAWFLGLGAVGRVAGAVRLSPAPAEAGLGLRLAASVDNARNDLTRRIAARIGGPAGALAAALVTGKRGLLPEEENERLRASGLYHIVSISGLHMVLAAGVFFWLARALLALVPGLSDRRPIRKWAAALAMVGATAYCVFSGSEVATERSLIMVLVMLGAILLDRPALSMRNLAISAIVVLLREPETLLGPSFQMSFAAVAALIAAHEWWAGRQRADPPPASFGGRMLRRLLLAIAASLMTTLIASLATAPFAAYHFHRGNPYGLIGNALAIPFVSLVVMPAAVAGTLLLPFGLDGYIWQAMGLGSAAVLGVAAWVAAIEGAVRTMPAFALGWLTLFAAGLLVLLLPATPLRLLGVVPMLVATIGALNPSRADVIVDRQGLAAAVRGADGRMATLGRVSRFTAERWLAADGDDRKAGDPGLPRGTACDPSGCVARLADGRAVALVRRPEAFAEDCRRAALVITPLEAPAFCRATARVLDRRDLAVTGSLSLVARPEGFLVRAARPPGVAKPWHGGPQAGRAEAQASRRSPRDELTAAPVPDEESPALLLP